MNRYILIHRLTGPAILLLLGTVALLHQAHLVRWNIFVPLLLILIGLIKLAERAALAAEPDPPANSYPGAYPPGSMYPGTIYPPTTSVPPAAVPAATTMHDFGNDPEGGK